jgi:hypothetical protein
MNSHSRVNRDYSPLLCNIVHYLEQLNLKINNTNSDVKILHKLAQNLSFAYTHYVMEYYNTKKTVKVN